MDVPAAALLVPERGLGGLHPIFLAHHPALLLVVLAVVVVVVLVMRSQNR